jgi:hypothetical protein
LKIGHRAILLRGKGKRVFEEGEREKGKGKRKNIITNAQCPMPDAQCPIA